jgi:hypothetical protein
MFRICLFIGGIGGLILPFLAPSVPEGAAAILATAMVVAAAAVAAADE